jgi:pyruvate/2-oxoglutarate dehydrogenase complex dihydrolipoamide dehydrogenase (E3) component
MDQVGGGKHVAVIEADMIGWSCVNVACIPTKALVRSAQLVELARRTRSLDLSRAAGHVAADTRRIARRTAEIVVGIVEVNSKGFAASGFELVCDRGRTPRSRRL